MLESFCFSEKSLEKVCILLQKSFEKVCTLFQKSFEKVFIWGYTKLEGGERNAEKENRAEADRMEKHSFS